MFSALRGRYSWTSFNISLWKISCTYSRQPQFISFGPVRFLRNHCTCCWANLWRARVYHTSLLPLHPFPDAFCTVSILAVHEDKSIGVKNTQRQVGFTPYSFGRRKVVKVLTYCAFFANWPPLMSFENNLFNFLTSVGFFRYLVQTRLVNYERKENVQEQGTILSSDALVLWSMLHSVPLMPLSLIKFNRGLGTWVINKLYRYVKAGEVIGRRFHYWCRGMFF